MGKLDVHKRKTMSDALMLLLVAGLEAALCCTYTVVHKSK